MDALVQNLILRIELSTLPNKDKEALYQEVATSLRSVVWPVLIKHAPKEELDDLAKHPSTITTDSMLAFIEHSVKDGEALREIEQLMKKMVDAFHNELTKVGVPQVTSQESSKEEDMEEKLRGIVTRIEQSKLSDEDRAELYATISEGLQATVWPVLLKYMPKEQLEFLAADPKSRVTVESYAKLIEDTIKDGEALKEIDRLMNEVLAEVDKALTEEGV